MKNLCTVEELEIVEIEIDEEIEKKNLKDFISTSLKLKNINLPKNKKIILNYIEELITPPINNLNYGIMEYGKNRCKKIITKRVV